MAHDYLTVADVLGMHTVLMQRYGGAPGVRDPGALEAALFRPQTGYYDDIVADCCLAGKPGNQPPVCRREQAYRL
jgi:death-on-curing protein